MFFCHLIHDQYLVKFMPSHSVFSLKKTRWLKLNSQHGSTTQRFYWEKSGFTAFLMISWQNNYLIMWHGGLVCYMLWSTRETELWLQPKVNIDPERSIIEKKSKVIPFSMWYFSCCSVLSMHLHSFFFQNYRGAGTCPAVLGICGVTKLHSIWWYSRIAQEVPWTFRWC